MMDNLAAGVKLCRQIGLQSGMRFCSVKESQDGRKRVCREAEQGIH